MKKEQKLFPSSLPGHLPELNIFPTGLRVDLQAPDAEKQ